MGCIVEFSEPRLRFEFAHDQDKQKTFINALLRYGKLDISDLASVLGVSKRTLCAVHDGAQFFDEDKADKLVKFFLMYFGGLAFDAS